VCYANHLHTGHHVNESRNALGEKPLIVHDRHADDLFFVAQNSTHLSSANGRQSINRIPCPLRASSDNQEETRFGLCSRMDHASIVSIVNFDHNHWAILPGAFVSVTALSYRSAP
jgi:hypothetical protein